MNFKVIMGYLDIFFGLFIKNFKNICLNNYFGWSSQKILLVFYQNYTQLFFRYDHNSNFLFEKRSTLEK